MKLLLKLFKALNSAQSPWQVTLAVVLGMIAGLTPMSGLQTVVILFLAFLLNIHLGIFFVSTAFFAGIGYLFDPWLEQAGYALLSAEGLKGLWTAWYNNGLMRLTHFNNTLVMGSTVVSLLLAVPLYVLLGWLIRRYRVGLGAFLERYPWMGTFGFLKAVDQKHAPVRWWGAGAFVVFGAIVAAVALLLVDPLLKWSIEKGGSLALQRDVRVGAVDTDFAEGAVSIQRLEIAGNTEGIDAVSADTIRFDTAYMPLLMGKVHIEQIAVGGVGFDTPATLKKAAAAASEKDAGGAEQGTGFTMPALSFPDPKSLLDKADLASVKTYETAKSEIEAIRARWEKAAKTDLNTEALADFNADLEKIRTLSQSKDPQQLLKLAGEIKAFKAKVDARKKQLVALKSDFDADQKRIAALMQQVKDAPQQDYDRLKSTYSLASGGVQNVIGMLFGETVKGYLATARKYYDMASPYLSSSNPPEAAVPPRGTGRWMRYPQTVPSPDLLIALTKIDGLFKAQAFAAQIKDISDDQKALGRPLTFKASSDGPTVKGLLLSGEDNRLGKTVEDSLSFKAAQIPTGAVAMQQLQVERSNLAFAGDLKLTGGSALAGSGRFDFSDTALALEGLTGKSAEVVGDILSGIGSFRIDATVGGTLLAPEIGASSNLDRQIAQGFSKAMSKELDAYKGELKSLLNAQTGTRLGDLQGISSGIVDVNALVGDQTKMLSDLSSRATGLSGGSGGGLKGILPF